MTSRHLHRLLTALVLGSVAFAQETPAPAPAPAPTAETAKPADAKAGGKWAIPAIGMIPKGFPKPIKPEPQIVKRTIPYTPPTRDALTCSKEGNPRTVIMFIGDGMGPTHTYIGKIGGAGFHAKSHIELCDYLAMASTEASDFPITDSAAGATALAAGVKTTNGTVGLDANGNEVPCLVDDAQKANKWTGIVSKDSITGATPACFFAHSSSRGSEADIAAQAPGSGVNLFIAGGAKIFETPAADGTVLKDKATEAGYLFTKELGALKSADLAETKVMALLSDGSILNSTAEGPLGCAETTKIAIEKLSKSPNGFFLMVEGARIDKESHKNDAAKLIDEAVDFDQAVGVALEYAEQQGDVLVVVTADHETGGVSVPFVNIEDETFTLVFSTASHTGVPVYAAAAGLGAPNFHGFIDNTDIPKIIRSVWK